MLLILLVQLVDSSRRVLMGFSFPTGFPFEFVKAWINLVVDHA
jgi:hypothetical protein